ncbi:MAG: phospho-N-acetylmuramoyl-pentapeptide-transferase [Fusobacteriaceae bacterium]|jgi:phospho-N-acetylmuramoyl-pentapeptide-transferase|nr:phospho-N-acetylmuramoyl-pentapeptide-transferase [Fusobacteriaceae bacterium]
MLYLLGIISEKLSFLKSIYLRSFICFTLAFTLVVVLGGPFIEFLHRRKFDEKIRDDGPSVHQNKKGTPTMGGVLIIAVLFFSNFISANLINPQILLLFLVTVAFAVIGFIDDYKKFTESKKGLSGRKKLLGQGIIAIIVWLYVTQHGITGDGALDLTLICPINVRWSIYIGGLGMLIFIIVILMGSSNAVNITDGLDGLAIMPMIICCAMLATIAYFSSHMELTQHLKLYYINGAGEITVYLAGVCGAGLGFLWYNFYPAQVFMGDTGSLTLGGILGVVAILLKQELILPVVGGIYVLEALSVILQVASFKLRGVRIFKMAPLHHHFELMGLAETKVTMRFWIASFMFGILALGVIRLRGLF